MYTENVRYFATDKNNSGLDCFGYININETRTKEEVKAELDGMIKGTDYELCEVILVSGEQKINY